MVKNIPQNLKKHIDKSNFVRYYKLDAAQRGTSTERSPYLASKDYRRCHRCTQLLQQVVNSTKLLKAT